MQCSATSFRINPSPDEGQAGTGTDCSEDYIGIEGTVLLSVLFGIMAKIDQ